MSSDEQSKAVAAAESASTDGPTIFDKIISKEIPATILYEDDKSLAFADINPVAKTHFLVIPKKKDGLSMLEKAEERHKEILGHLLFVANKVAQENEKLTEGYRVVINNGKHGCQSVYHLHLHVVGGNQLGWPPC
eukprot:g3326.t1